MMVRLEDYRYVYRVNYYIYFNYLGACFMPVIVYRCKPSLWLN
jgi:hypothetical protein